MLGFNTRSHPELDIRAAIHSLALEELEPVDMTLGLAICSMAA
ncbi:hypothetical protein ACU4GD_38000 [Cupriavidus basilensis]